MVHDYLQCIDLLAAGIPLKFPNERLEGRVLIGMPPTVPRTKGPRIPGPFHVPVDGLLTCYVHHFAVSQRVSRVTDERNGGFDPPTQMIFPFLILGRSAMSAAILIPPSLYTAEKAISGHLWGRRGHRSPSSGALLHIRVVPLGVVAVVPIGLRGGLLNR
jgi:hypothetical protein